MRRRLIQLLRAVLPTPGRVRSTGAPGRTGEPGSTRPAAPKRAKDAAVIEYSPCLDGDPDPGEVVWTWVPYEDDPSQGKDRPVAVIGRRGDMLLAVPLTSKQKSNEHQVPVGAGPWDREGRASFAKVDRLLDVAPHDVRREGAVLDRTRFDAVVRGVQVAHAGRGSSDQGFGGRSHGASATNGPLPAKPFPG